MMSAVLQLPVSAVLIGRGGFLLCVAAERLADAHGWKRGWVGLVMLATVTSLPELVSGGSAVVAGRGGAVAAACGGPGGQPGGPHPQLREAVLAIDDALYLPGPLLAAVRPVDAATAISAVVMTGLVMIGLVLRPQGHVLRRVSWIGIGLGAAYLLNTSFAWLQGGN